MRNLIRSPLTWMIALEVVVVGALAVVAWNVVSAALKPGLASPMVSPGDPGLATASPVPDLPSIPAGAARGPLPGLNVDSGFWRTRLEQLNRDQAQLAELEWRIVHGAMDAARRYLETVILPAIERAERAGGQTGP